MLRSVSVLCVLLGCLSIGHQAWAKGPGGHGNGVVQAGPAGAVLPGVPHRAGITTPGQLRHHVQRRQHETVSATRGVQVRRTVVPRDARIHALTVAALSLNGRIKKGRVEVAAPEGLAKRDLAQQLATDAAFHTAVLKQPVVVKSGSIIAKPSMGKPVNGAGAYQLVRVRARDRDNGLRANWLFSVDVNSGEVRQVRQPKAVQD